MNDNTESTKVDNLKQVKLSKYTAQALKNATQRLNALAADAGVARDRFESAAAVHQEHLLALIQDGGYTAEDFASYGVIQDEAGDVYLRAKPQQ